MTVPKSQRGESRLYVHVELRKLVDHTLKKTKNGKKFGCVKTYVIERGEHGEVVSIEEHASASRQVLEPHPKKTRIQPIVKPLGFLGFDFRVRDGCVYMLPKPEKVKEQRRKLGRMARLVHSGKMPAADYIASLECMCNHLSKGDNPNLAIKQKAYGMQLIGEQT